MKRNAKVLALMALMAAGTASAATEAGTSITNIASAAFDIVNPDGTTKKGDPVTSNPVTTTVKSVPSFTITPNDTAPTTTTNYASPAQGANGTYTKVPGETASFLYTLTNTGNVPNESYSLGNTAPSATNGGTGITAGTPTYYLDDGDGVFEPDGPTNGATGDKVITSITGVNPGDANAVKFWVAYPIDAGLANGAKVGTSPLGTRIDNPGFTDENTILPVDANNSNVTTVTRTNAVNLGPSGDPDGNGPSTTYTTPESIGVTVNTNDSQTASTTTLPKIVTFTNTIANPGNVADTYTLTATTAGLPAGTEVSFTDLSGNPINEITVKAGEQANFLVKVDYLDTGLTNADFAVDQGVSDSVTVTATSKFDPSNVKNTTVNNVVVTMTGVDATSSFPTSGAPGSSAGNPVVLTTCTAAGVVMSIPVSVTNTGTVTDTYNLTTTVTGLNPNTVTLYDTAATSGGSVVTSTGPLAPGVTFTAYARITVACDTPSGQSVTVNFTATSATTGTVTDTQTVPVYVGANNAGLGLAKFVKGGTGGSTWNGVNAPADYGTGTGPQKAPGDTIDYVVIGKNFYNTEVRNVILTDALNSNVTFSSATCAVYSASNTVVDAKTCSVTNTNGVVTTSAVTLAAGEYVRMNLAVKVN